MAGDLAGLSYQKAEQVRTLKINFAGQETGLD
jgi:hypothetical protein